jgi:guanylate kinase
MEGKLVVLSGFSGAGKGTVIKKLMQSYDGYVLSVSMTTRKPRDGEKDGVEYHFVSNEAFEDLLKKDGFLEHAGFVDHYYGTPKAFVVDNMAAGRDVLLAIEVQGAMQIREIFPEAVLIFIAPPEAEELARRLLGRATETAETVTKRLVQAATEVKAVPDYDYLVINDDVDACADALNRIIRGAQAVRDSSGECPEAEAAVQAGQDRLEDQAGSGRVYTEYIQKKSFAGKFGIGLAEVIARRA